MKRFIIINLALLLFCGCTKDFCPISGELSTGSITKVRNTTAVANITVSTNSLTKEIGVLYSTSSTPDYTNALKTKYNDLSDNGKDISLTGLTAGTLYYYRAYATDGANNYVYGDVKTFTTTNYKITAITTGDGHSFAIDETGSLWAWGQNNFGQYGNGTTTTNNRAVLIKEGTKFKAIAATTQDNYSLAIDESGSLWFWGADLKGDHTPIQIMCGSKFKNIACGLNDLFAIDESGNLWAWGEHIQGSSLDGKVITPVQIKAGTKFKAVAVGGRHSLFIDEAGNLWAGGDNSYGQVGYGITATTKMTNPIQIISGTKFKSVAAGGDRSFAIDESETLWAWGYNETGELGYGNWTESATTPVQIGSGFKTVTAGYFHTLAIDEFGDLWVWGGNYEGALGLDKDITTQTHPAQIIKGTKFKSIAAGPYTSLAIDESGKLWGWGRNMYNQINKETDNYYTPIQIDQF